MHRLTSTWDRVFGKLGSKRTSKKRKGFSPLKRRSFALEPLEERALLSVSPFGDETLLNSYTADGSQQWSSAAVAGKVVVGSSTERILDVGVSLPAAKFQEMELSDKNIYSDLMVPGAGEGKIGTPDLPVFGSWILIPNGTEVSISADPGKAEVYENISLPPVQPPKPESGDAQEPTFVKDETVFLDETDFPGVFAETESIKYKRGQACTILWVYPYQYNPVQEELKVYPDLEVTVEFDGEIQSIPLNLQNESYGNFMSMAINAEEVLSAEGYEDKSQLVPEKFSVDGSKEEIAAEEVFSAGVNGGPGGGMATMDYGYEEGCDMLIITHPDLEDAADTLAEWRIQKGLYATVVNTNTTGSTSSNIENYIDNAFSTWDPAPSYLLLMGDSEQVPTCYVTEHPVESGYTASDLHYADVNTPCDYVADMAYGRLAVDTLAQANNVVNRIIAYEEGTGLTSSYFTDATIVGAFQDGSTTAPDTMADRRFAKTCEDVRNYLNDEESYITERIYDTYNGYNSDEVFPTYWHDNSYYCFENDTAGAEIPSYLQKPTFPWDGDKTDITSAVEDGTFLLVHRDHGSTSKWGTPYFHKNDVDQLDNGDLRPIVWSINCSTGGFDRSTSECFIEHWLRHDTGGSVGLIAASRVSFSVHNDRLAWGLMDAVWDDFLEWCTATYPDHDPIYSMGDALNYGKEYYMTKFQDNIYRKATVEEYHWFGDPSMEMWTDTPATISPTYSDTVTTDSTSLYVQTGISGTIVGLSQNGNYIGKGTAAANGKVTVTFDNQPSIGAMDIYISAHNHYIHKGTVDVAAVNDMGTGGDAYDSLYANDNATEISTNASGTGHIQYPSDRRDQYKIPVSSGDGNCVTVSFTAPAGSSGVDVVFFDTDKSYIGAEINVSSFTETITTSGDGYLYLTVCAELSNDAGIYELSVSVLSVTIISPSADNPHPSNITEDMYTVEAEYAGDADYMEFFVDGSSIGTDNMEPYTAQFNLANYVHDTGADPDPVEIKAVAYVGGSPVSTETIGAEIWLYGDVTGNGVVNMDDAILACHYFYYGTPLVSPEVIGDVTGNGVVNMDDVILICNHFYYGTPLTAGKYYIGVTEYYLDGRISEGMLNNYLSRAVTHPGFGSDVTDAEVGDDYDAMLYENGHRVDHWGPGSSVPHWMDMLGTARSYAAANVGRHMILRDSHANGFMVNSNLMLDFHSFPIRPREVHGDPQLDTTLQRGLLDSIYGNSVGEITPDGWSCDSAPHLVELDNFGISNNPGDGSHDDHWVWGYDEISWFAGRPETHRNDWLEYAHDWVMANGV